MRMALKGSVKRTGCPSKRETALALMRVAGYHDDQKARVRLIVENKISRVAFYVAWSEGRRAKAAGVPCECFECKQASLTPKT